MRSLIKDNDASAIPIILYLLTIISCGALYTLFFIEVGYDVVNTYIPIPASDSKTFIMMCMYAIPLFIIVIGSICLIKAGLKRDYFGGYYQ